MTIVNNIYKTLKKCNNLKIKFSENFNVDICTDELNFFFFLDNFNFSVHEKLISLMVCFLRKQAFSYHKMLQHFIIRHII